MGITTTVLYPNTEGKKLDLDYYMNKHMPMAEKLWGPLGMLDWDIVVFKDNADGTKPVYRLKTVSAWKSLDSMTEATTSAQGKPVLDDMKNFTDETPVLLVGDSVGSSTRAK